MRTKQIIKKLQKLKQDQRLLTKKKCNYSFQAGLETLINPSYHVTYHVTVLSEKKTEIQV